MSANNRVQQGTYEFMSVNLLNHITKPVQISDELESFFHLLVYYSVRYLNSNCHNIASWIDNYFHSYSGPERMLSCGEKSCAVEVSGVLQMRYPDGAPLSFRSPMDGVLAPILKRLRAHYKVTEHEATKSSAPSRPETPPPLASAAPPVLLRDYDDEDDEGVDEEEIAEWEAELQAGPPDRSPTAEDRELAKKVADHKFMLDIFSTALRQRLWAPNDRVAVPPSGGVAGGAVDATSDSERASTAPSHATSASTSSKRRRTAGPQAPATTKRAGSDSLNANRLVSLPPARLHASTRRVRTLVRSQARTMPIRARPQRVGCR